MEKISARPPDILFIDNFDSFSFNLVEEFRRRGCRVSVWRNDVSVQRALELADSLRQPPLIVISPGPGSPGEAGCCIELIRQAAGRYAIFGVCLGHQAIIEAFGGTVGPAGEIVHGKAEFVRHDASQLFHSVPNPMRAARYHSLAAKTVPACLRTIATANGVMMAVEHVSFKIIGVQFHPESILTPMGGLLIDNVIKWVSDARAS